MQIKSHKELIILLVLINIGSGCSNHIDLYSMGESIPVVYCLLNPQEDIQYLRLGRTFNITSDFDIKKLDSDSLFWKDKTEVYIVRWENNDPVETFYFEQSDVTERDQGLFPTEGLSIYKAVFTPQPGDEYHLFVYFPDLDKIVSSITRVISIPEILDPEFVPGRVVSFDTISPYYIRWRGGDYPGLYQGVFKMNYSESDGTNMEFKSCLFETPLYDKSTEIDLFVEKISGTTFFKAISSSITVSPGMERELINFEYTFYAGSTDLAILVSEDLGGSSPFTITRNVSNITGGEGVFSSLYSKEVSNLEASVLTKHLLATSEYTKNLGFNSGRH